MIVKRYTSDEIDVFAAYCAELDRCYLLPLRDFYGKRTVHLRVAPSKNNQLMKINNAEQYEFGARLSRPLGPIAQLGERLAGSQKVVGSSPTGSIPLFPPEDVKSSP